MSTQSSNRIPITNSLAGYFLAYKYLFNAELTYPEPFSRGFTVPEAESEEEDVIVQSDRGSQLNPLILDDSDAASENSDDSESQDNGEVTMAQLDEEAEQYEALFEGESFEEDGETAFASLAESDVESNVESDAESPGSVIYDDEDENIEVLEEAEEITATKQIEAALADQDRPSVTVSASVSQSPVEQASAITSHHQEFDYAIADLPFPPIALSQDLDSTPFDSAFPPPLPPRPSQKRQRVWDEVLHGDYEQWTSASPVANFGTHAPHLFQDTPQQIELPHISSFSPELAPAFKPAADRIQTPPPTLAADVISSTPPPARRTGVSITEIVDEQPLTPTSVSSRKRSADDAFEEEAEQNDEPLEMSALEAMAVDSATITENAAPAPKVAIPPSVEQIVPRSERHIAQPRSILRKALRAAKLMVPATAFGAAASIAVLTALPESFFTIA